MNMTVKKVLVIEACTNLLIMLGKLTVGLSTQSAAIIADALHSLTDIANNFVALLVVRLSHSPPDSGHHYGHKKFEQLVVLIIAAVLVVVAFEISINSIKRFGTPVVQSPAGLVVMITLIFINAGLAFWEDRWAKRLKSAVLNADAKHTLSDVLTSLVVLVGWQFAAMGYYWLDTLFALVVAGIIFYLAINLILNSVPILVDQNNLDVDAVKVRLLDNLEIKSVQRLRSRSDGESTWADIVITVNPRMSLHDSHEVANEVERVLKEEFDTHDVVVHVEPDKNK